MSCRYFYVRDSNCCVSIVSRTIIMLYTVVNMADYLCLHWGKAGKIEKERGKIGCRERRKEGGEIEMEG